VAITSRTDWATLCKIIGNPLWANDDAVAAIEQRNQHADEIERAITEWASGHSAADGAAILQSAGVPAAPAIPNHALADDPQLAQSGFWQYMERKYIGRHLMGASPFRFDGKRPALRSPAPLFGEHSAKILAEARSRLESVEGGTPAMRGILEG
jgi:crotonobetainyl-CoA:carnitine CoA-transferase CaiB-like acyl-CoA transferase